MMLFHVKKLIVSISPIQQRARGQMPNIGHKGKKIFGSIILLLGILILSGLARNLGAAILNLSREWLVRLSTSIQCSAAFLTKLI